MTAVRMVNIPTYPSTRGLYGLHPQRRRRRLVILRDCRQKKCVLIVYVSSRRQESTHEFRWDDNINNQNYCTNQILACHWRMRQNRCQEPRPNPGQHLDVLHKSVIFYVAAIILWFCPQSLKNRGRIRFPVGLRMRGHASQELVFVNGHNCPN